MKYLTLFSTLLAVAAAVPLAEVAEVQSGQDVKAVEDAQARDPGDASAQGVKILKKFAEEPAKAGLTRVTKKIGTWSVTSDKMISTFKMVTDSPCGIGGCYVTAMEATIRYPDGKEANADTGAWLHHIGLFGLGTETGGGTLWACGNERPTLRLNSEEKYGIDWPSSFMMLIDLMSEVTTPKSFTLEITYETAPKLNSGYKAANMYWLTLGQDRAAKDGIYSFETQSTRVKASGNLLYSIGHMHDGGDDMQLFSETSAVSRNGKLLCKSIMHYGTEGGAPAAAGGMEGMEMDAAASPAAGGHGHSRRDGHGGHGAAGDHIRAPGACTDFGSIIAGSYLRATAQYDATKHELMMLNGKREKLMGNMRVYVGPS